MYKIGNLDYFFSNSYVNFDHIYNIQSLVHRHSKPLNDFDNIVSNCIDKSKKKRISPRNRDFTLNKKKFKRYSTPSNDELNDPVKKIDEDDELTDRCVSPTIDQVRDLKRQSRTGYTNKLHSPSTPISPNHRSSNTTNAQISKNLSNKHVFTSKQSSQSSNCTSYSSSDADDGGENGLVNRSQNGRRSEDYRRLRSPVRKDQRLAGTSSTMLRRPPFAPPPSTSSTTFCSSAVSDHYRTNTADWSANLGHSSSPQSNDFGHYMIGSGSSTKINNSSPNPLLSNCIGPISAKLQNNNPGLTSLPTTTAISSLPRSHLPPNKRAAAAATAAALNTSNLVNEDLSNNQRSTNLKSTDCLGSSPKKIVHKGIQVIFFDIYFGFVLFFNEFCINRH